MSVVPTSCRVVIGSLRARETKVQRTQLDGPHESVNKVTRPSSKKNTSKNAEGNALILIDGHAER